MKLGPAPILCTKKLSIGYTGNNVLMQNLDLELNAGQLVCFMGPNGVGKSTLIRTLAGLQKPLTGTVSSLNEKLVAVVLTDRITESNMTVFDLVSYGRYPYLDWNIRMQMADTIKIEEALAQVRMTHLSDKKLFQLSDGQMQMAMIARALTQETPLLLLDEPTAHLDLNNRVEIMSLLSRLTRETGKAILVATHELDLALQTADLIWLATNSKEIKTGIPEDLVLNGSFDEVFQFKGYNLRTGKINFNPYRQITVKLKGEGHEFLWTRNALERNGYTISDESAVEIVINPGQSMTWSYSDRKLSSLNALLEELRKIN